mgnify:CR=1 FL=1
MFSDDERLAMVRRETADIPGIEVVGFDALLMNFARAQKASVNLFV